MADITTKKITSVDDTLNISALFVNDNGTLKQIQLSDLINILNDGFYIQAYEVKAIQELSKLVGDLKKENAELKKMVGGIAAGDSI